MTISGADVLLVGENFHNCYTLTDRLRRCGFRCHFVINLREASDLLSALPVDLVLSNTHLPDGTGFGLVRLLAGLPVSAFLCLPVEHRCFWLPAIDDGKECFGSPALLPSEFASALDEIAYGLAVARSQLATFNSGSTDVN